MAQHARNPHVVTLFNRKLYDLTVIEQLPRFLLNLQEINIQKNFLNNIDILNKMHRLRKINAGDNYLANVNLQLSKL
jgi:fumarylacetoacetate (FAA) hydrolase family protein